MLRTTLKYHDHIIKQVLLSLYNATDTVKAINSAIAQLGEHYGVSRVYIFEDSEDGSWCRNSFEWCAEGIEPQKEILAHSEYTFQDGKNTYYLEFDPAGVFYCPDISLLDAEKREILEPQGIHSMLQCLMLDDQQIRGFIGYDDCQGNNTWSQEQLETLILLAKILGTFLFKFRQKEKIAFTEDFKTAVESDPALQLKAITENINGGIMLTDVSEQIELSYISPSFFKMLQLRSDELEVLRKALAYIHPEDLPIVHMALRKAAKGEITDCVYRSNRQAGIWRQMRSARLAEPQNGKARVISVVTDISQLKYSEQQYQMAEEKYRLASKLSKAMLWEVDLETRTLYLSEELSRQFGDIGTVFTKMPESFLATKAISLESQADFRRMFNDLFKGDDSQEYNILSLCKNGSYIWFRASFCFLRNFTGIPIRSIGIIEKIPNINSEMQIFRNESKLLELAAPYLDGVIQVNLNRDLIERNTLPLGAHNPSNYSEFYALLSQFVNPDNQLYTTIERQNLIQCYQNGQNWVIQGCQLKNGNWIHLAINLLRNPVSNDLFAFGYARNINNPHKWEQLLPGKPEIDSSTLLYSKKYFRSLTNAIIAQMDPDEFCSLTVLKLADLDKILAKWGVSNTQKFLFLLGRLSRILGEDASIIGHLSENQIAYFNTISLPQEEQLRAKEEKALEKLNSFLKQLMPELDINIYCGFTILKYREANFDKLTKQANIACLSAAQSLGNSVISYTDSQVSQLNEPETWGKTILDKPRVLIADDDLITRKILNKILQTAYTVDSVTNGQEALELLQKNQYELLISDIQMPVKNGWEVLEEMDKNKSDTPVVIITADTNSESEIKALEMGATDVIVKPFIAKTLLSRVSNIIGRRMAARLSEKNRIFELQFQHQSNLLWAAEHDKLTDLYNKQAFYRHVQERLQADPQTNYAIIRWDLDNFKVLNDVSGVASGDQLLRDIANALRKMTTPQSIYARIEADHFAILLPAELSIEENFLAKLNAWFEKYPLDFKLNIRAGIYHIEDPSVEVSVMCDRALLALKSIKGSFSQRSAVYDASLRNKLLEEQELSGEMLSALQSGQFQVYFQPQYNYDSQEMTGAEALVRWKHPVKGMLPPGIFIPLFERNGFISLLDEYVWSESCRYLRKWLDADANLGISVSVNISRIDLYNQNLCDNLKKLIAKYQIPYSSLHLEITESAYMQSPTQLIETVKKLQETGFIVEMDDFGSGYSSLTTLKDVPVDVLKLDMRFLEDAADNSRTGNILSSVIRMAHWLNTPLIAEGVETKTQADYLKSLGCFYMQGYYFNRPMPAEEFEKLLQTKKIGQANRYNRVDLEGSVSFWEPSEQNALLFNSFVGGAAILEYHDDQVEILRANDKFYSQLNTTQQAYLDKQRKTLERFDPANQQIFIAMLQEAIQTGDEAECELESLPYSEQAQAFWSHNRVRLLARSEHNYLFYLLTENITKRKQLEKDLQIKQEALQQYISQMKNH